MPINTPTGYLDITNATLRGSKIVTTGFVGIANANPTNHLSIGSNLHINDTHSNVLQISGNINAASVVLGGISIAPTFDLEVVTNTGNTTPYTVEFNNAATAFVTTANATIGDTLTASKLVGDGSGISAIQSSNVSDFGSNVSRITTLETDLGNNSARITNLSSNLSDNSSRITNLSSNLSDNSARITNLSSNLSDNSSRITALESGDISISGDKTFTGDIIFESNVHMNSGNVFVANTVNLTVSDPIIELGSNNSGTNDLGIIMTRPNNNSNVAVVFDESVDILRMGYTLNGANDTVVDLDSNALAVSVQGALTAGSNLEVGTANLFVDTTTSNVGVGVSSPAYKLDVGGDINIASGSNLRIGGSIPVFSRWTASGSDIYRPSDNVGIGTANPGYKLHIRSGTAAALLLESDNGGTGYPVNIDFRNYDAQDPPGARISVIDDANYGSDITFNTKTGSPGTGPLSQRMIIQGNGYIGIGTTSPGIVLDVGSSLSNPQIGRNYATGSVHDADKRDAIYFGRWDGTGRDFLGIKCRVDTHTALGYGDYSNQTKLEFYTWGNNYASSREVMCIRGDGNVGIGTASPTYKLNVLTDTNYDGISLRDSTRELLKIAKGNNGCYINMFDTGVSKVNISTTGNTWLNGGNVGIGTASPSAPLHILSNQNGSFVLDASSIADTSYSEMRMIGPGQSIAGLSMFCNGANRTADGGASTTTIRNNSGPIVFGNGSYVNRLRKPKDDDYIIGTWKTSLDASATTTVGLNVRSCVSTPAAPGSGMSGNIGRFTAPEDGYYYTYVQTLQTTRGTSNLLIVFNAGGTNFGTNNLIGTYDEIIDLRSANNVEENYNFVATLYMEAGDYIQYSVHSSGYTDNSTYHMQCSAFLLNRV